MSLPFELIDSIRFWARHRPRANAIRANGADLRYPELLERMETIRRCLSSAIRGRVAILSQNKTDTIIGVCGALLNGCSAVVLNPHLAPEHLRACLIDTDSRTILASEQNWESCSAICETSPRLAAIPHKLPSGATGPPSGMDEELVEPVGSDEWGILYSSGSTGLPKGIERDFESMQTEFLGWCLELRLSPTTRFYIARPTFYTGGLVLTMSTLLAGGTAVLNELPQESTDALIDDIAQETAQSPLEWCFLVPEQVRGVLASRTAERIRQRVTNVLVMGARISGEDKQSLAKRLGCEVRESWGNSESLGTITDSEMLRDAPDSIGRPFLCDSMCIVDDDGNELKAGTLGRLAGSEDGGFTAYSSRPVETARVKRRGLIVSEDLGWMDEEGRFYIAGRVSERVNIAGRDVFLPDLEKRLRTAGLNGPFCMVCRPSPAPPELGVLIAGGSSRTQAEALLATVAPEVPQHNLAWTAALPTTPSGKVDRIAAASIIWPASP